jgi:SAM-dependent methyltransferase
MPFEPHRDRVRAESFGSYAEAYDRHRPPFPNRLVEDLIALAPKRVLDAASGTGLVARALAARGLSVLGVELDPRMAEIARRHGLDVEVARFEEWNDAGRRFDLVTFGDAWHWIDPAKGIAKVASILEPGGMLVRFFKGYVLPPETFAKLEPLYRSIAPGLTVYGKWPEIEWVDPVAASPDFVMRPMKEYAWDEVFSASQWTGYLNTASDHRRLPSEVLTKLLDDVREALGPEIAVRARTLALFAQRSRGATSSSQKHTGHISSVPGGSSGRVRYPQHG